MKDTSARAHGRREFLKVGGAVTAALLAPSAALASTSHNELPGLPANPRTPAAMPTRNLGKTGYKVGIFSLGGQAALEKANNFDVAVPIIERALDLGVNYIDTSSIYGGPDRWSEQYVGKVMAQRRNEAFLATKTKERTREGFDAHDREVAAAAPDRPRGPVAVARHRHDDRCEPDLRQGRRDGSAARDAAAEGRALSRHHRTLSARRADRSAFIGTISTPS